MTGYIDKPERQCAGKKTYSRRQDARKAARKRNRRDLNTYRCPHCGRWHLGHSKRKKEET